MNGRSKQGSIRTRNFARSRPGYKRRTRTALPSSSSVSSGVRLPLRGLPAKHDLTVVTAETNSTHLRSNRSERWTVARWRRPTTDAVRAGPAREGKRQRTGRVVRKCSEPWSLPTLKRPSAFIGPSAFKSPAKTRPIYLVSPPRSNVVSLSAMSTAAVQRSSQSMSRATSALPTSHPLGKRPCHA